MKVILKEDVDNLGEMGETVRVAAGYARNYLIPRQLAVVADSASAKQIEHEMRIIKKRDEKRRKVLGEQRNSIEGVTVELTAKAGEGGKLFGSVTNVHIAEKLAELGHEVDRKKLLLPQPIKSLGEHEATLRLASGIEAKILVVVTPDEAEEVKEPEEESVSEALGLGAGTEDEDEAEEDED